MKVNIYRKKQSVQVKFKNQLLILKLNKFCILNKICIRKPGSSSVLIICDLFNSQVFD